MSYKTNNRFYFRTQSGQFFNPLVPPMFPPINPSLPSPGDIFKPILDPIRPIIDPIKDLPGDIIDQINEGIDSGIDRGQGIFDKIVVNTSKSISEAINNIIKSIFNIETVPVILGFTVGGILLLLIIAYIIFKVLKYL